MMLVCRGTFQSKFFHSRNLYFLCPPGKLNLSISRFLASRESDASFRRKGKKVEQEMKSVDFIEVMATHRLS
jgi:hypothetical protein